MVGSKLSKPLEAEWRGHPSLGVFLECLVEPGEGVRQH